MDNCNCSQTVNIVCPLCDIVYGTEKKHCKQHDTIYIYGKSLHECQTCRSKGFIFMSGYGGVYDNVNNKRYYLDELHLKPLIKNFSDFESRPQICNCHKTVDDECGFCSTMFSPKIMGQKKEWCPTHDDIYAQCKNPCPECKVKYASMFNQKNWNID